MHTLFRFVISTLFSIEQVLRNAVSKTYNRISDLRKEILSLKKNISSAEVAVNEAKAEIDAAESKLALVDGEPVLGENPVRLNRLKSRAEKAQEELVSIQESVEAKEALLGRATDENEVIDVKFSVVNSLETFFLIKGDT
jgi:nuclear cap-binding protein subunit 1